MFMFTVNLDFCKIHMSFCNNLCKMTIFRLDPPLNCIQYKMYQVLQKHIKECNT